MQPDQGPAPLQATPALDKQNCFLFTYVLFQNPGPNDPLGLIKMVSVHEDLDGLRAGFIRALPTNENLNMKWGEVGKWEAIRRPENDEEATYDIVRVPGDDDNEFMGERLSRDVLKEVVQEPMKDRAAIDQYKENVRVRKLEEKKQELRKQAMKELQDELDDPTSISSYAQLHWKRLQQKSMIAEKREELEQIQKALRENLVELRARKKLYPHYEAKWQNEIRRIHGIMMPKKAKENPVDNPQANLGEEDDDELANLNPSDPKDEFDQGIGVEAKGKKGKEEDDGELERKLAQRDKELTDKVAGLIEENINTETEISRGFLPNTPIKKVGRPGSKGKNKGKAKKNAGRR